MKILSLVDEPQFFAVKLIKLLAVQSSQVINPRFNRECYNTYHLWEHYHNPYLTIDRPDKKNKDEKFLQILNRSYTV